MLEFLGSRGEIAVAGRRGKQRLWDLAERVYPAGIKVVPADEARKIRDAKRLRSLGVARPQMVGEAGIPAEIEGTSGLWRLDPKATAKDFEGRTALLSPFDRLIHDRVRALELFDFEYLLEMYKPKDKRRWGYFALPVLHHDRLVGKVDATADRKSSRLHVDAVHQDVKFTRAMTAAVNAELHALASGSASTTSASHSLDAWPGPRSRVVRRPGRSSRPRTAGIRRTRCRGDRR